MWEVREKVKNEVMPLELGMVGISLGEEEFGTGSYWEKDTAGG